MNQPIPNQDHLWQPCTPGLISQTSAAATAAQQWQPCTPGLISQTSKKAELALANVTRQEEVSVTRRRMLAGLGGAAAVAAIGFYASTLTANGSKPVPGGIGCSEVIARLQEFTSKSLTDAELVAKIDHHLKVCPKCKMVFDQATA